MEGTRPVLLLVVGALTIGCPVTSSEITSTTPPSAPTALGEQAETAVAVGQALFFTTAATGFNDYTIDANVSYSPSVNDPQLRTVRRGVSIMGWAYSGDAGGTWTYEGKLAPPAGWAALWGDPSMATDRAQANVIYYVQMGATHEAWDAVTGGANETPLSPGRDMVDGFCIARSSDGGQTFSQPRCRRVRSVPASVDRTAVTVGGDGRVYVALTLRSDPTTPSGTVVFRSTTDWGTFEELPLPDRLAITEPWLVTDPDGSVWFGARRGTGLPGETLSIQRWNGVAWDVSIDLATLCGFTLSRRDPRIGFFESFRNAHSYLFDVGRDAGNVVMGIAPRRSLRGVMQLARPSDGSLYLQFVELLLPSLTCFKPRTWSTELDAGQQFMPTLNYRETNFQPVARWMAAYLTTENSPDPSDFFVQVKAVAPTTVVTGPAPGARTAFLALPTFLTPASSYACGRVEGTQPRYWGDYFGLGQGPIGTGGNFVSVSTYMVSADAPPCDAQTPFLARPLHLSGSRW